MIGLTGIQSTAADVFTAVFSSNVFFSFLSNDGKSSVLFMLYILVPLLLITAFTKFLGKKAFAGGKDIYILPHLDEKEKLAFLETYFLQDEKREYIQTYLSVNRDVSVIKDYSAGSNAMTMLCMNQQGTFFRKYAFGADADKLKNQIDWIEQQKETLPLPQIVRADRNEWYCCYDMKYDSSAIGYFYFIHSVPVRISWNILKEILHSLQVNLYIQKRDTSHKNGDILFYLEQKVFKNIELIKHSKYLQKLWDYDELIINGISYPNLKRYEWLCSGDGKENLLAEIFSEDPYTKMHGDLTVENIICMKGGELTQQFYLIDPNADCLYETSFLDYAKLLQSLHGGYEFLTSVQNLEINRNQVTFMLMISDTYKELYNRYKSFLYDIFTVKEVKSIFCHEIVHFLRLMPYKIRKDPKKAVIFYAQMCILIEDIVKMFPEQFGKDIK